MMAPPKSKQMATPAPSGTKRKRGESEQVWTKPIHQNGPGGESLIVGKTVEFTVGDQKFFIHEKLATANSPYLADLRKKGQVRIAAHPELFRYFNAWLYDKDGAFVYGAHRHYRSERTLGFPYTPLVKLYTLAYQLRVASFANAVLQMIMTVRLSTNQVADRSTISLVYKEKLESFPIHRLFVDQAAYYGDEEDIGECDNLAFVKAVSQRLVSIRDKTCPRPQPQSYYVAEIAEPEPEEDDDDCMIIEERPAENPGRTPGRGFKQEERERFVTIAPAPEHVEA